MLLAAAHLRPPGLPADATVEQLLASTGAGRTRAYELRDALLAVLPSLQRPVGRPTAPPGELSRDAVYELRGVVAAFLMEHPGCVYGGATRRGYSDRFRHFVLALHDEHADVDVDQLAEATLVPLGTLKSWLSGRVNATAADDPPAHPNVEAGTAATTAGSAQTEVVLACWETWRGTFGDFCKHMRQEERIPLGTSLISQILFVHGKRRPQRRPGRSPDERALHGAFKTFFGGAQWVGDGSPIDVTINEQSFVFNLELIVDAHSGGFVGMSVRDQEDSAAVTDAFDDAGVTTGEAALALLLDNRPSNHTPEVDGALGEVTLRMRATPFRPQNKAHVEGGFGLFQQTVPALDLHGNDPRELARQVLALVAQTWARTLNHRPRADRGGRSRVDLYGEPITAEQIDAARAALEERCKKQNRARLTALMRLDPTVRAILDDAFERLALLDPEHHLRVAIARYPIDVIVEGVAIFEAKRRVGTLPPDVDARYLLGIVQNIGNEREGIAIAEELLRARLDARDRLLAPLVVARDAARRDTIDVRARVVGFVDRALAAERRIDRHFWLLAVAEDINRATIDAAPLVGALARRIHATHRVPYRERTEAVSIILENVTPLK